MEVLYGSQFTIGIRSQKSRDELIVLYFNFTNNKTKIAQTPTVTGNRANCASPNALPLGTRYVSPNIAKAVSTPRTNLILEFI